MRIERYNSTVHTCWNEFLSKSKNGTFLFARSYMEYHQDRFPDYSLVVCSDNGAILAILPASLNGKVVSSHGGLTYGGFVVNEDMKLTTMLQMFDLSLTFLKENKIEKLVYKTIPSFYSAIPAEEDRYALFVCNSILIRRDVFTVVDQRRRLQFQERRRRAIQKANKSKIQIQRDHDWPSYWNLLETTLKNRYGTTPVHSLAEIELLASRFPENIKLYTAKKDNSLLAGVVVYECAMVARAQYIASSDNGRNCGALDLLFQKLLDEVYSTKTYFDFGGSNEEGGRVLNDGLVEQKEGFGARVFAHDHYELDIVNWKPGTALNALLSHRRSCAETKG